MCLAPVLSPTTLCHVVEKPSRYCTLLMPVAGLEPGPPVQQVSALSITPLPLSDCVILDQAFSFSFKICSTFVHHLQLMRTMNNISAHNVITEHRLLRGGVPAVAGGGCADEGVDMCHVGFSSITIFLSRVPWLGILVSNLPNHHDGYSCSNRQTIFK